MSSLRVLPWILLSSFPLVCAAQDQLTQSLDQGWQLRLALGDHAAAAHPAARGWLPALVPGSVQGSLLAAGKLEDANYRDNEAKVQWVGLADWEYRESFRLDPALAAKSHIELVFDGLDTFADVELNGHRLLQEDNMFRRWSVPVREWIKPGMNDLRVSLYSPIRHMREALASQANLMPGSYDSAFGDEPKGRDSAVYVRKAQYGYGWDWGPRVVTEGIWRPVRLEAWDGWRAADLHIEQQRVDAARADLEAQLEVEADHAGPARLLVTINPPGGGKPSQVAEDVWLRAGANQLRLPIHIDHPQRWYPLDYGAQPIYTFQAELDADGRSVAVAERRTGLRSIELRRDADRWGRGFAFVVNGLPIFAKGANLIPLDSLPERASPQRHRELLLAARAAHMNMLRVWGGGYYETDDFYDQADALGILIWQDFMFGGAIVPPDPALRESARREAIEQVTRLRDHPSIVLWCGNNEVQADWESWAGTLDFKRGLDPEQRERVWTGNVVLFDGILRDVVSRLAPGTPYWGTSPGTDFAGPSNQLGDGDYHSWKVWAGSAPVEDYLKDTPRFLSEFGLQSLPALATIDGFTLPADRRLDSAVMQAHQKFGAAVGPGVGNDRLLHYIRESYGEPNDFAETVYLSQLMQADGVELAAEHMRSERPRAMGVLFWQLNDAWPGASWSSIDYAGRWKALQYRARHFYAPLLLTALRHDGQTEVSLISDLTAPQQVEWRMRLLDLAGRELKPEQRYEATLPPLSSAHVAEVSDKQLLGSADPHDAVVVLDLVVNGQIRSSQRVWFEQPKQLALRPANLQAQLQAEPGTGPGDYLLRLSTDAVLRGLWIDVGSAEVTLDDNSIDLLPGTPAQIHVHTQLRQDQLKQVLKFRAYRASLTVN